MTLHITERECPAVEGQHDHIAEAAMLGTAIVSFGRPSAAKDRAPLTIIRLNPSSAAPVGLPVARPQEPQPDAPPDGPAPGPAPEGGLLDRNLSARTARRASRSVLSSSDSTSASK